MQSDNNIVHPMTSSSALPAPSDPSVFPAQARHPDLPQHANGAAGPIPTPPPSAHGSSPSNPHSGHAFPGGQPAEYFQAYPTPIANHRVPIANMNEMEAIRRQAQQQSRTVQPPPPRGPMQQPHVYVQHHTPGQSHYPPPPQHVQHHPQQIPRQHTPGQSHHPPPPQHAQHHPQQIPRQHTPGQSHPPLPPLHQTQQHPQQIQIPTAPIPLQHHPAPVPQQMQAPPYHNGHARQNTHPQHAPHRAPPPQAPPAHTRAPSQPQPQHPSQPSITGPLGDPAQAAFSLLQPTKAMLEQTWNITVRTVQNELAGVVNMHAALQGQHVRLQDEHARLQNEHRALQERYAELEQGYRGLVRFGQGQGQEEEELRAQFVADKNKEVAARHVAERRLVELQDRMEEIRQSCKCGRKAKKPTAMIDLTSAEEVLEEESKFNVRSLSVNDLRRGREEDQHDREGQRKKRRRLSEVAEAGASESQSAPPTASTGGGDCVYSTPLSAEADSSTAPAAAQTETSDQQLDLQMDDSQNLSMDVSPSATLVQDQTPPALEDKGGEDEKDEDEILSGDSSPQRSPGHSGNAAVGKIGMQHIDLVYETRGDQMYCRMCFARKQADPSASVVEFPTSAPWTDLAGHCEKDHAVACAALAKMSASQLAESRQRLMAKHHS